MFSSCSIPTASIIFVIFSSVAASHAFMGTTVGGDVFVLDVLADSSLFAISSTFAVAT